MPTTLPLPVSLLERRLGVEEGSLNGPDKARAEDALTEATGLALLEVSASKAKAWEADLPDVVRTVIVRAARRDYTNPDGYETQAVGEVSGTVAETSGVFLTAREVATIRKAATGRTTRYFVGSIRTPSAYYDPETDG